VDRNRIRVPSVTLRCHKVTIHPESGGTARQSLMRAWRDARNRPPAPGPAGDRDGPPGAPVQAR